MFGTWREGFFDSVKVTLCVQAVIVRLNNGEYQHSYHGHVDRITKGWRRCKGWKRSEE